VRDRIGIATWLSIGLAALGLLLAPAVPATARQADPWATVTSGGEGIDGAPEGGAGWQPFEGTAPQGWAAETGVVDLPALPPVLPPGAELGSVLGVDGRTQVTATTSYPFRAIAYLSVKFGGTSYMCTGWFIGPHTLATAGHCVYDPATGWASSVTVYPGRNGGSVPYGSATAVSLASVTGWTQYQKQDYDYGAIKLGSDTLGNTVGWFGFRRARAGDKGRRVWVTGYPADKPGGTMWQMKGRLRRLTKRKLFYPIDTYGGQSGSPVRFRSGSGSGHWGLGVHAYGAGIQPCPQYNSGTKLSKPVFGKFLTWRNSW